MKLEEAKTPKSDYVLGATEDPLDKGLPVVMRGLERRLAVAEAALLEISTFPRFRMPAVIAEEAIKEIRRLPV